MENETLINTNTQTDDKKRLQKKGKIIQILTIVFAVIFVATMIYNIYLFSQISMRKNYDKYIHELEVLKNEKGLSKLAEINSDIVAWITIADQNISFPVIKTQSVDDENFYLNHDFKKHKNILGCPYQTHDTDISTTDNTTFIGHSSFNIGFFGKQYSQSIFAKLNDYLYTSSNYNYQIVVETLTETYTYKIFASIKFNIEDDYSKENSIYKKVNFNSQTDFETYYNNIKSLSRINNGITASYGDKFLTLFTCNSNLDYRTMVIAKKIN